ncbi:MAG: RhuM family protein [Candidatus Cloacimonetes bacterium]|nr:RhuM family protein [Candidatus Cloacimonadota bacterium]
MAVRMHFGTNNGYINDHVTDHVCDHVDNIINKRVSQNIRITIRYVTDHVTDHVERRITEDETACLNPNQLSGLPNKKMLELFGTTKQNIGNHLKSIFLDCELNEHSVVKESLATAADGKRYKAMFYSLEAIISVSYHIKNTIATRLRIWATERRKEYIIKGFVWDDEGLTGISTLTDHFDELLVLIVLWITMFFRLTNISIYKYADRVKNMVETRSHHALVKRLDLNNTIV